jgi:hypothetical protein
MVASQWPAAIAILEPHENCEWRSGLVGTGLLHQDKAFLQTAPLCILKCAYNEGRLDAFLYEGDPTSIMN